MECSLVAELIRPCRLCLVEPFIQSKMWFYWPTTKRENLETSKTKAKPEHWNDYHTSNEAAPYRRAEPKGEEVLKGRVSFS